MNSVSDLLNFKGYIAFRISYRKYVLRLQPLQCTPSSQHSFWSPRNGPCQVAPQMLTLSSFVAVKCACSSAGVVTVWPTSSVGAGSLAGVILCRLCMCSHSCHDFMCVVSLSWSEDSFTMVPYLPAYVALPPVFFFMTPKPLTGCGIK